MLDFLIFCVLSFVFILIVTHILGKANFSNDGYQARENCPIIDFEDFLEFYEKDSQCFELYKYSIGWYGRLPHEREYTFRGIDLIRYRNFYRQQKKLKQRKELEKILNNRETQRTELYNYYKRILED